MRHEITQHVKLLRRQVNRLAGLAHDPTRRVELDAPNTDRGVRVNLGSAGAPDGGPDSRCQLTYVERLGNVVVRAGVQCSDLVFLTVAHRQHENPQERQTSAYLAARP